jgi:hypothetical protein
MTATSPGTRVGAEEVAQHLRDNDVRAVAEALHWTLDNGLITGLTSWQSPIADGITPAGQRLLDDADGTSEARRLVSS